MDLYAVFAINDGYEEYEILQSVWLKEKNAHKAAEEVKSSILDGRKDSRYKQWWAEEALNPERVDVLKTWRLYDTLYQHREDNHSDYVVEIRYISTGD
jgi:hypothetical protein